MGSFNETCALSNLNIPVGCPINLLFLTKNPYVECDQHEAQRGVYHYDNWFLRTPPLQGKYADYGKAKLKRSSLIKLVEQVLSDDVVERPFGFNQYHAPAVYKGKKLDHYLNAAWEGRLQVSDWTLPSVLPIQTPDNFPTWKKVLDLLKKAKLPIQTGENVAGYNAQDVIKGVVCVHFNSYNLKNELQNAEKILSKTYDCSIQSENLVVVVKDGLANPTLIADLNLIDNSIKDPNNYRRSSRESLPVLAVMVRQDVWNEFVNLGCKLYDQPIYDTLMEKYHKLEKVASINLTDKDLEDALNYLTVGNFRNSVIDIPFQTTLTKHIETAAKNQFADKEKLIKACAEAASVEKLMSELNRPWYIPPIGKQWFNWELNTELLLKIHDISLREFIKEEQE